MSDPDHCEFCRNGAARGGWRPPPKHVRAIARHLERTAGGPLWFVTERRQTGPVPIDVCVAPPAGDRDYSILLTIGMSDLPLIPPRGTGMDLCWAELAMCLPADWRLDPEALRTNRWGWPIDVLRLVARHPHERGAWVWHHHAFDFVNRLDATVPFDSALLDAACLLPEEMRSIRVSRGKEVHVLTLVPLHREEYDFWHARGGDALCRALKAAGVTELLDPRRRPCIEG